MASLRAQEVLDTNVLGSMLGSRAAARVMSAGRGGKIFLIDGAGATGGATANSAAYGASKRALTQLKVRPCLGCWFRCDNDQLA